MYVFIGERRLRSCLVLITGARFMDHFIARANIDHYLDLLHQSDLPPEKHASIVKLLIVEEDKMSQDLEQLQFAEKRAARGRDLLSQLRYVRDGEDLVDRASAERLITTFETTQSLMDNYCQRLRTRLNARL
jgi:hypothetical protein